MSCVGFWSSRGRNLVAVSVDDDGHAGLPLRAEYTDEGCWSLLAYLEAANGLDFELVTPLWLARGTPIARFALERGVAVWLVPEPLITAMRAVGRLNTGPPQRTAAVIARLPLVELFRVYLRRLAPGDQRQLSLW
jgi:hypothetical protein